MASNVPSDAVGRRILCNGDYGTVLYVGEVPPTPGLWLGVEWDNHQRGKHNGSHEGIQYFKCRHPTGGSFIRPNKANFGIDFISAVKQKYGLNADVQGAEKGTETSLPFGRRTMESLGVDSIGERQKQLTNLRDISVDEWAVSSAGQEEEIREVCQNVKLINMFSNLLSSWKEVENIACQVENLESLNLSNNKMKFPSASPLGSRAFCKLRFLALNQTGVTWTEVLLCAAGWPSLEELYLASNDISILKRPFDVLHTLKVLDLADNQLTDENQLYLIADLPRLERLILTNNGISSVCFPDVGFGFKTRMFPSLTQLIIRGNRIAEWSTINELDKLQRLQSFDCRNNPIMDTEKNVESVNQLIIAKIGQLTFLNKSQIFPEERKGAELDYRKKFGIDWLKAGGNRDPNKNHPSEEFLAAHPRFQLFCDKYGAPEKGELERERPFSLQNQMLNLTFKCPDNPDQKPIEKTLPGAMSVRKVKGLLHHLIKIQGSEMKLSYESSKMKGKEFELENDLKALQFYSIEDGDCILIRW